MSTRSPGTSFGVFVGAALALLAEDLVRHEPWARAQPMPAVVFTDGPPPRPSPGATLAPGAACQESDLADVTRCELWAVAEQHRANAHQLRLDLDACMEKLDRRTSEKLQQLVVAPDAASDKLAAAGVDVCPSPWVWVGAGAGVCAVCGLVGAKLGDSGPSITIVTP